MIDAFDFGIALLFALLLAFGGSNIYIVRFLRLHDGHRMGMSDLLALTLGHVANYVRLRRRFVDCSVRCGRHGEFHRAVAFAHAATPLLIVVVIVGLVVVDERS